MCFACSCIDLYRMQFLTTNAEFQSEFSMASGYSPVIKSVVENKGYLAWLNKADGGDYISTLAIKVSLQQADAYFAAPAFNGSSIARQQVGLLMQKVFFECWTKDKNGKITGFDRNAMIRAFRDAVEECEYQS